MITSLNGIIQGGVSVKDFSTVTEINLDDSEDILNNFVDNGFGTLTDSFYYFEAGDKLKIAISFLQHGLPLDEISIALDWRDFEGLTAEILSSKNFAVIKNLMLTKPRMEIDVVGIRLGIAILIDCKHWKTYSQSSLSSAVRNKLKEPSNMLLKPLALRLYLLLLLCIMIRLTLLTEFRSCLFFNFLHLLMSFMAMLIK